MKEIAAPVRQLIEFTDVRKENCGSCAKSLAAQEVNKLGYSYYNQKWHHVECATAKATSMSIYVTMYAYPDNVLVFEH